jgi:hypothetical protein
MMFQGLKPARHALRSLSQPLSHEWERGARFLDYKQAISLPLYELFKDCLYAARHVAAHYVF